jgi:hypothetical protein
MRHYTFEDSAVVSDLKYWGYFKGRQCAADGYPPESTLRELLSGRTDDTGHRILCLDMTPKAWQINARVMTLPTDYIAALIGRFCLPIRSDGHPYEASQIAEALGVGIWTYKHRLTAAKKLYREKIFGPTLRELSQKVVALHPQTV